MPKYIIDEAKLEANLCFELYPLVAKYLDGATASGLFEARLAHEEMPGK